MPPQEELSRWLKRELDRGSLGVTIASVALFVIVLATLAIQVALIVLLAYSIYPLASGATEKTIVLVAIFGALAVFLGELSAVFSSSLAYLFLTRPRRRKRQTTLEEGPSKPASPPERTD